MARKQGNVITLSGIGQTGTMSRGAKLSIGLLLTGVAVTGIVFLVKDIKKTPTDSLGRLGAADGAVLLGDHNSRVMAQYEQRQRQIGMQRRRGF